MWITSRRGWSASCLGVVVGGCSVFAPDISFEESADEARANAAFVADVIGDAARLERTSVGPHSCGGSNRYANFSGYLPLDETPGEDDLDRVADAIAEPGFSEDSREDFASGPYRLWEGDDDMTISVTVVTDENAVDILSRGRCARPPE